MNFKDTSEINVSNVIIDQIIGQDNVINIIKKASKQRRHVLLIGNSGTGKSMAGQGMAELLPQEKLVDILSIDNPADDNNPLIKTVPKGEGKKVIQKAKLQVMSSMKNQNFIFLVLLILSLITPWLVRSKFGDIMGAASLIGSMMVLVSYVLFINVKKSHNRPANQSSKTISRQFNNKQSPIHRCIRSPCRCFTWNSTSRSFAEWGFRYTRL